jgi:small-conductance mechanosensitive channel
MASQNLQRRAAFFAITTILLSAVLFVIPFIERFLEQYATVVDGRSVIVSTAVTLAVNILHLLKVFLWMALVVTIVRFFTFLLFKTVLRRAGENEITSLVKTVVSIIIYIVAFFIIFQSEYPSVNLAALFTGSTIIGIVVGLALQDTLGNLFAGIAIQADQPFQVGDVLMISNRGTGVVEGVSWRGIKIRTFQNKLLVMSNAVMSKETVEVAPKDNLNARIVHFNTVYSASPSKTATAVREAVRQVENVSPKMRPVVRIRNFGDSSLDWEVKYWCENYARYNDSDAQIRQRIWYVFNREKIDFAFPTRTVHMEPRAAESSNEEVIDSLVEQLCAIPIFAPLTHDEVEQLAAGSVSRLFAPGEVIVRRGQEGKSMFVILKGSVKVQIPEGPTIRTINALGPGDFFGEMSLLTGQPRTANVITDDETEVLQIKKSAIKPIFEQNPEVMEAIGTIIEDRRERLKPQNSADAIGSEHDVKGVISSLKRFFGMD